ncbi:CbiX/SirB N-terminal domain-containing protein [Microbacterium esteraromaticum]|uniref:sirohydrochlorin chelatase n=1 Tax=Microbacterium esteraromaticum TaxID=57043 RepID=UPI002367A28B|nr:CbiX/SirB N-terminal domain-containing protein [Microbacterium esteraromaticum]WDH78752.1 CbiX/SirB N-terminal domain-containing protein [Microbacterium esteraromaticum]
MPSPALLAVSHGTSDAAGAADVHALVEAVRAAAPHLTVHEAFVDVQQPDVASALEAIDGPVVVVPLLLSSGFHVFHDLHGAVAHRSDAVVADPLGPDPRLAEVLMRRLPTARPTARPADSPGRVPETPVVLAVAGSRDERSAVDAEGMAEQFGALLGRPVHLGYLAAREPELGELLAEHPDAVVATYLLARGYFFDLAVRRAHGHPIALPLLDGGRPPAELTALVLERSRAAAAQLNRAHE